MYRQIAMNITSYHSTAYALSTPQEKQEVHQLYICGITTYLASQKGLCPLVFGYFCRVTKVPPPEGPAGRHTKSISGRTSTLSVKFKNKESGPNMLVPSLCF